MHLFPLEIFSFCCYD
uniref:Uncharacterized protein n=1 Tax=Rhizophora mucronata TaxID=61149 RepID=A0A2P2MZE7_RHIMU